jgi:RNA-directed DNA polymerase
MEDNEKAMEYDRRDLTFAACASVHLTAPASVSAIVYAWKKFLPPHLRVVSDFDIRNSLSRAIKLGYIENVSPYSFGLSRKGRELLAEAGNMLRLDVIRMFLLNASRKAYKSQAEWPRDRLLIRQSGEIATDRDAGHSADLNGRNSAAVQIGRMSVFKRSLSAKEPLRTFAFIMQRPWLEFVYAQLTGRSVARELELSDLLKVCLFDIRSAAITMGISEYWIRKWIDPIGKSRAYRIFSFKKRSGGKRTISAPRVGLKVFQSFLAHALLENIYNPPAQVFGFVAEKSFVDNAKFHLGCSHLMNADIRDFFPSITKSEIEKVLKGFGLSDVTVRWVSEIVTLDGALPQGSPSSPIVSNLVLLDFDNDMQKFAVLNKVKYSRYADDITISSKNIIPQLTLDKVRYELSRYGLTLNDDKTRFIGDGGRKEITGLVLGDGVRLTRSLRKVIRAFIHNSKPKSRDGDVSGGIARANGYLNLIKQVGRMETDLEAGLQAIIEKR